MKDRYISELEASERRRAKLEDKLISVEAERDLYREALERIAAMLLEPGLWEEEVERIAREALGGER